MFVSVFGRPGKRSEPFWAQELRTEIILPAISGMTYLNLKTNLAPPPHKFLNWYILPKDTAHTPPSLDVFDTFYFERLISGKKIIWNHTSPEGF